MNIGKPDKDKDLSVNGGRPKWLWSPYDRLTAESKHESAKDHFYAAGKAVWARNIYRARFVREFATERGASDYADELNEAAVLWRLDE